MAAIEYNEREYRKTDHKNECIRKQKTIIESSSDTSGSEVEVESRVEYRLIAYETDFSTDPKRQTRYRTPLQNKTDHITINALSASVFGTYVSASLQKDLPVR